MGPGAFGYGGSGEMEMRRGHLLLDAEPSGLSPRLDTNDAGFLERANNLDLDVVSGYLETRPRGWFQNFALLGTGETGRSWDGVYEGSELGMYMARPCFATTCTARWSCRCGCPAGTSSRPPTAGASSAAGATAPA